MELKTELKIDFDFKNIIPPLSPEEFEQLEQNILTEKHCREAILTWKGYIVDGHNRYAICQKHNIPFEVSKLKFANKIEALAWIAEHQLGRRNLSDAVRIELAAYRVKMLNMGGIVRKSIAKMAGLSEQTVQRYMKVAASGNTELIDQLRRGEMKIGTAYGKLKAKTKVVKRLNIKPDVEVELEITYYCEAVKRLGKVERFYGDMGLAYEEVDGVWLRGSLERQMVRI